MFLAVRFQCGQYLLGQSTRNLPDSPDMSGKFLKMSSEGVLSRRTKWPVRVNQGQCPVNRSQVAGHFYAVKCPARIQNVRRRTELCRTKCPAKLNSISHTLIRVKPFGFPHLVTQIAQKGEIRFSSIIIKHGQKLISSCSQSDFQLLRQKLSDTLAPRGTSEGPRVPQVFFSTQLNVSWRHENVPQQWHKNFD